MQTATEAANLLVYDPSKFVVIVAADAQTSQHRSLRSMHSAQFCESAPKVISYDPDKPVKTHMDSSVELVIAGHIRMSSFARRVSTGSAVTISRPLEVSPLFYCLLLKQASVASACVSGFCDLCVCLYQHSTWYTHIVDGRISALILISKDQRSRSCSYQMHCRHGYAGRYDCAVF